MKRRIRSASDVQPIPVVCTTADPYGLYDVYRLLRGKAPDSWWSRKEIEMDFGDGLKLAKHLSRRKGKTVKFNADNETWYVPGQYYWNDCYFYPFQYGYEQSSDEVFSCQDTRSDVSVEATNRGAAPYIVWVKIRGEDKWRMFKSSFISEVDDGFLARVSEKNNTDYEDVKVLPQGVDANSPVTGSVELDDSGKYWMATYTRFDGKAKKLVYRYDTESADEAASVLEDIIPEPYTKCTFRGSCEKFTRDQLIKEGAEVIQAAEEAEDDITISQQEFTSEKTSINSQKLPAVYKMIRIEPGKVYLDYGGGKFDNASEHAAEQGATLYVYDPYNRTAEHNREVIKAIRKNGGADYAICSNVLNVIKEAHIRKEVLENIKRLLKSSGRLYLTVYEGRGDNGEGETKSGYQLNRPTAGYLDEVREVFPDAVRKGKLITATPSGSPVQSARYLDAGELTNDQFELLLNVRNKVHEVLMKPNFGFPEEDVNDYYFVDGKMDNGAFVVEVRAELGYESMVELAEELNPLVAAVDSDAYFDMEAPGIMTAYLYHQNITSATYNMYNFPERSLDPPEPKYEPEDLEEVLELDFDFEIIVDSTGEWELTPEAEKDFEGDGGKWYGETYPGEICDSDSLIENFIDLIEPYIPTTAGKYRIKGTANMSYWVEGYIPEHEEDGLDMQEAHSITFQHRQSSVENFEFSEEVEAATDVKSSTSSMSMKEVSRDTRLPAMYDAVTYSNGVIVIDRTREGDDAEYHWAKFNPTTEMWSIIKGMKVVKQIAQDTLEDGDIGEIALELDELNKSIKPQKRPGVRNKRIHTEKLNNGYYMAKYSDGAANITKSRPYDDAEYYYAVFKNDQWLICKSGKVFKRIDEEDLESLNDIVDELEMVNAQIKPKIDHT